MKKYSFNKNYFGIIDSEDKAYFLGLLYADGYNYESGNKYVSIRLQEGDKDILVKFQEYLKSNYPIVKIPLNLKNSKWKNQYSLQINGKLFSENLSKLGCVQNKSSNLKFPSEKQVPKNLIKHFIRGYFDGDGSVWEGKRKIMNIKDSTYKLGRRNRIIHNTKLNITGTPNIIENIQEYLIQNLNFKKNKINTSKNLNNCVQLEYSGRKQIEKFYNYFYKTSNIYIERKRKKFENIINRNL